ncbi:MAG: tryptophan synthase subunit beta [Cellulosilyticaceae bacterium]
MGKQGRYGIYGGQYIPETLMYAVKEVEKAYEYYKSDKTFQEELGKLWVEYAGRPSLLYYAEKLSQKLGGAKIYLKREDLNHTGSHKINNVLGQLLLAQKMGKKRVIAETGAGQHGVATATVAALLGLECEVFMGAEDMRRQALNVYRMELLGAKVTGVHTGTATLKDAINGALAEWCRCCDETFYCIGSVMGPHPYPEMVRDFQSIIGKEAKAQLLEEVGKLPDAVIACVGGGSNAMGMFYEFIPHEEVALIGVEAAGKGLDTEEHAATMSKGRMGIFHGMKSQFLQDSQGNIAPVYSISAGLDYPGVGPEHAELAQTHRAQYVAITDDEAVEAFEALAKIEGIIPAIESAHAIAYTLKYAHTLSKEQIIIVNLSGRGDKDVAHIAQYKGVILDESHGTAF